MSIRARQQAVATRDHVVQFYAHDDELIATVGFHLADAIRAGDVAVIVATDAHRRAFEAAMVMLGVDVAAARRDGVLVTADAEDTLAAFLHDGRPDAERFGAVVGELIRGAAATGRAVRVYGEMVALLWDAGHVAAAIELESLWNALGDELTFSLFCAYPVGSVSDAGHAAAFAEVRHLHSAIIPGAGHGPRDGDAVRSDALRSFPATTHAPRSARRFVVETLTAWCDRGLVDVDLVDDAALVVTELATNAVLHASSDFTVAVSRTSTGIRIAVHDTSAGAPVRRNGGAMETGGRGVAMVSAMASQWGAELMGEEKVVWAELRR